MYQLTIKPRFLETDALGHINHTVLPVWLEDGREPIFLLFMPELNVKNWNLILAKLEISYKKQIYFGTPVELRTYLKKIGNASMTVRQEIWQNKEICAVGEVTNIHFDHQAQKAMPIPKHIRQELEKHLYKPA
ncbi:MAG: acyl-CoA thioesterase [Deltaproteobacteria bacterium]|jgi:acyl-CoA thioester hydrolase|nr:acyl-CoA thioesterase [Deltaproteobacteria bacterium]